MGPQFHETGYGRRFLEVQLPELTKAINRQAAAIEKQNELTERSMVIAHEQIVEMQKTTELVKQNNLLLEPNFGIRTEGEK